MFFLGFTKRKIKMVIQDPLVAAGAFSVPTSLEPSVGKQTSATVVQLDQLDALVSQVNRKLGAEQQLADPAMCWSRGGSPFIFIMERFLSISFLRRTILPGLQQFGFTGGHGQHDTAA